jgi:hypothetical protein
MRIRATEGDRHLRQRAPVHRVWVIGWAVAEAAERCQPRERHRLRRLTVVAVGLLSLSSISVRTSSQTSAMLEAQANARLALVIAIGELQKQMGPDQRISANSAILAESSIANPHWTGVWDSWRAGPSSDEGGYPSEPSDHQTIPGSDTLRDGMHPTYALNRSDHFRRWLYRRPILALSKHSPQRSRWGVSAHLTRSEDQYSFSHPLRPRSSTVRISSWMADGRAGKPMARVIAFRADASLQIGTGHVMRCLTLAAALRDRGADCQFICRADEGNLIGYIRSKGYITHTLPAGAAPTRSPADLSHTH